MSSFAWIETFTGKRFDILDPQPDMIDILDIAHAGSQINRFTGHCKFPYPVSQHCRLGSYLVPQEYALDFLLHDAAESYIGDMNRPLKHSTIAGEEYRKVEAKIQLVIADVFKIDRVEPKIVKEFDNQMLLAEKDALMGPAPWGYTQEQKDTLEICETKKSADIKIVETNFYDNKRWFLDRFYELERK